MERLLSEIESIPKDTTRDAFLRQLEVLRRLGISGRATMTFELSDNLRQIVEDGVRHHHPDWAMTHVRQEVLRIVLGNRLYNEVFGEGRSSNE